MRSVISSRQVAADIPVRKPTPSSAAAATRLAVKTTRRVKLRARELARLRCQNLELDIMNLRQEIAALETTRRLLYARTLNRAETPELGSFERIVREFYLLMHAGYVKVVWKERESAPVDMEQFMRACFDDALAVGEHGEMAPGGLDSFLQTLEQIMVGLHSPKVSVLSTNVRADDASHTATVTLSSRCASTLTATVLDALFPHLPKEFAWLRAKLLGREMITIAEGDYTFSMHHGRVVRVNLKFDQSESILKLAESMEELSILKGEWTPRLVPVDDVEDNQFDTVDHPDGIENRFEVVSDHEDKRSNASLSPMSLQHVLSPERETHDQHGSDD